MHQFNHLYWNILVSGMIWAPLKESSSHSSHISYKCFWKMRRKISIYKRTLLPRILYISKYNKSRNINAGNVMFLDREELSRKSQSSDSTIILHLSPQNNVYFNTLAQWFMLIQGIKLRLFLGSLPQFKWDTHRPYFICLKQNSWALGDQVNLNQILPSSLATYLK